jgi:hypothetical protein
MIVFTPSPLIGVALAAAHAGAFACVMGVLPAGWMLALVGAVLTLSSYGAIVRFGTLTAGSSIVALELENDGMGWLRRANGTRSRYEILSMSAASEKWLFVQLRAGLSTESLVLAPDSVSNVDAWALRRSFNKLEGAHS